MRTRIIIVIIAILIIVGVAAFFLLRPSSAPAPTGTPGQFGALPNVPVGGSGINNQGNSNPTTTAGIMPNVSLSVVDTGPVIAYFPMASGTVIAVRSDGSIVSFTNSGIASLSSSSLGSVASAAFSHDGKKIVVTSGNPQNSQSSVFDVSLRTWTALPANAYAPAWSPLDNRLAYLKDNGNGSVAMFVVDAAKSKLSGPAVGTFYVQDMVLNWTAPTKIFLTSRPSAFANSAVLSFDLLSGALTTVLTARPGLEVIWNPSPLFGLLFSTSQAGHGGHSQLIDGTGAALQSLAFLALPSKCTFAQAMGLAPSSSRAVVAALNATSTRAASSTYKATSTTPIIHQNVAYTFYTALYCGVPRDQATLAYYPLPDAYEQRAISTIDDIYRVNVLTGKVDSVLVGSPQSYDVTDLYVAGNKLYFINRYDQRLYSVVVP